jgi:anti-sigma factor RsiW
MADGALWRQSRLTDATDDETARFLDLAGYADGRLDPDDAERVAEWLARDPAAAADVTAARHIAAESFAAAPEAIVARACALVDGGMPRPAAVIPFPLRRHGERRLPFVARWGSLAAAMAVASWLGFTLGVDTSRSLADVGQTGDRGFLFELLDPSTASLSDLPGGNQT